jgi:predicted DCC family thiol-disulfide oxidoreductase YuxK
MPMCPILPMTEPLIVFDGECVFCSGWVKFALKHDRQRRYRFLAAQTPLGAALYRHYGLDGRDYETNILIEGAAPSSNPTARSAWWRPRFSLFAGQAFPAAAAAGGRHAL